MVDDDIFPGRAEKWQITKVDGDVLPWTTYPNDCHTHGHARQLLLLRTLTDMEDFTETG